MRLKQAAVGGSTIVRSEVTVTDGVDSSSLSKDKLGSGCFICWRLFLHRVLPDSVFTMYDRGVDHTSVTTKGVQEPFSFTLSSSCRTSVFPELPIASHVHPSPSLAEEAPQRWVI